MRSPGFDHLLAMTAPVTFAAAACPEGRTWIERLPDLLDTLRRRWNLEIDAETTYHGYNAVIVLVRRKDEPLVLKLHWPPGAPGDEARALRAWDGHGAVLLLERLDHGRTLMQEDRLSSTHIAGALLRRLAIPAPPGFRNLRDVLTSATRDLAALVEGGDLDAERAERWVIARCADYLLCALEHGLTHDPVRCRRILQALL